jgi:hypothetical protein
MIVHPEKFCDFPARTIYGITVGFLTYFAVYIV